MFHPTRGGTRGGRDQFKWDDVKEDKYRENYLGNSLHAAVGRWQKGRDITWYAKGDDKDQDVQASKRAEIKSIKDAEAEAMAEALGYKSKRKVESNVTEKDLKSAISKTDTGVQDELDQKLKESSAMEGLGFKSRAQRKDVMPRADHGSLGSTSRRETAPVVPLIPPSASQETAKEKEKTERPSKDKRESRKEESERRSKRRRDSRSASPSRNSRRDRGRDRDRSKSKSRSRSRDRDRDRDRDSNRNRNRNRSQDRYRDGERRSHPSEHHSDERRGRERVGDRDESKERGTQTVDSRHSRRDHAHRQGRDRDYQSDRWHRSTSRSRSRSGDRRKGSGTKYR